MVKFPSLKKKISPKDLFGLSSGFLALTLAHIIWGANIVVAKLTLFEIPVMSLAFLRFGLATILLIPFILPFSKTDLKIKSKDLVTLLTVGIFLITLPIVFLYEGLKLTTAINTSVITLIAPILSVIAGWLFLREKIYMANLFGIITGLLGTITIVGFPLFFLGNLNTTMFLGNMLLILSSIFSVIGLLLGKKLLNTYSPFTLTFYLFLIGAVSFLIPAIIEYIENPNWIMDVTIIGILGLLFITVLSTVCAFYLMNIGLKKMDTYKVSLFQYMNPAIAATLAVPLLGERISFSFILGTCLIVLGVYWGTLGKNEHPHIQDVHHRT